MDSDGVGWEFCDSPRMFVILGGICLIWCGFLRFWLVHLCFGVDYNDLGWVFVILDRIALIRCGLF